MGKPDHDRVLSVRLPRAVDALVRGRAEREGRPVSAVALDALRKGLALIGDTGDTYRAEDIAAAE